MRTLKPCDSTTVVLEASNRKHDLVDFTATWCEPCKMLAPTLKKAAEELKDKIDTYKLDIDKAVDITNEA